MKYIFPRGYEMLKQIKTNGYITFRKQSMYLTRLSYYIMMNYLSGLKLVRKEIGNNNEFKWFLTPKGEKTLKLLEQLEATMNE
jgi:molybdenum-dependent DNA-binding transcriptional regulator ModE